MVILKKKKRLIEKALEIFYNNLRIQGEQLLEYSEPISNDLQPSSILKEGIMQLVNGNKILKRKKFKKIKKKKKKKVIYLILKTIYLKLIINYINKYNF